MTSILPKDIGDFGCSSYWDKFFTKLDSPFEWYGDFTTFADIFAENIKRSDSVLEVGCGNSVLSADIWDKIGCSRFLGIDYSSKAIEHSRKLITSSRPGLRFEHVDVFELDRELSRLEMESNTFNCIIDKGTLDAIDNGETKEDRIQCYFNQISSALGLFGRYILITLAQDHIISHIANYFLKKECPWIVTCIQVTSPIKEHPGSFSLPLFAFIMTKMKPSPNLPQLRLRTILEDKPCSPISENLKNRLVDWIKYLQSFCVLEQDSHGSRRGREFEIVHARSGCTMFQCRIVTAASRQTTPVTANPEGVFLEPQDEASVELFKSPEGLQQLLDSMGGAACALIASTNPILRFASLEITKSSLSNGLSICPVASTVKSLPIYSTPDGYPQMQIIKERNPYAVITERSKRRKGKYHLLVDRLDTDLFRVISSDTFFEPSSVIVFTWIVVARLFATSLKGGNGRFVYLGVPPCLQPSLINSIELGPQSESIQPLIQMLCPEVHIREKCNGCEVTFFDPPEGLTDDCLSHFLCVDAESLVSQGICFVLDRSTVGKIDTSSDLINRVERFCGSSLQVLFQQEFNGACICILFKKDAELSKTRLASRLLESALKVPTMRDYVTTDPKSQSYIDGFVRKADMCLQDAIRLLKTVK
uniref:Methyltranfer_dom domain-containing protein n=1 Tax=Mesocestoides corti TaxID=53468 RepID=A0A5K3FGT9_MESCO